ncbi:MAG: RNA methyltransferase [Bdellovibrionota bacterium]|nr:MAG: RNA methyltransferase [Bdellovibrionota bacterium]
MNNIIPNLSVALLHDDMLDKQGKVVTTSLTLLDVHDIARSARTFGLQSFFIAHSLSTMRTLASVLHSHWQVGYGATYNPNRKEALSIVQVVAKLQDAEQELLQRFGAPPKLIATSARPGAARTSFADMRTILRQQPAAPFLLMLGTGWGMSEPLLNRADYFLEPIHGVADFNHLSVRSACAIMLDRLMSS